MYVLFVKNEGEGEGGRALNREGGLFERGGGLIEDLWYIFFVLCLLLYCPL